MGTDGSICYADRTGIYRQAQGGSLREQVVDGTGTALSLSSNYISQLCCAPDGSYLAIVSDGSMQTSCTGIPLIRRSRPRPTRWKSGAWKKMLPSVLR